jgi:hypothetical protein
MSFWSSLGEEFAARRRRLHRGPMKGWANPIEFAVVGGLVLAVMAPLVARNGFADAPWGPALPLALIVAYLLFERRRQQALSAGGEPEAVIVAYDARANWLFVAFALAGAATFAWALLKPPPETFVPEEPPATGTFDVNIGP